MVYDVRRAELHDAHKLLWKNMWVFTIVYPNKLS